MAVHSRRPEYREASWFEAKAVSSFYRFAKHHGFQVDHIVPRNHPDVCGLHCYDNLQLLTPARKAYKSNKFWPDMWAEQTMLDLPDGPTSPIQVEMKV